MHEYALITLDMIECASLYLGKETAEFTRILNLSTAVDSITSLYKLLSSC